MGRGNFLDALRLLRRIKVGDARDRLGHALLAEWQAADAEIQAAHALAAETVFISAADYASWLPAGQARLAHATQVRSAAEAALAPALDAVLEAGTADLVLAAEVARRDVMRRKARMAKEQALLDDMRPAAFSRPAS